MNTASSRPHLAPLALALVPVLALLLLACGGGGGSTPVAPPSAFALLTPADDAAGASRTPVLAWQAADRATSYSVVLATDAGLTAPVLSADGVTATTLAVDLLAAETRHSWRVVAHGAGGATTCAADFSFVTTAAAPPVIRDGPASPVAAPGSTVVLSVTAVGLQPLAYQWQRLVDATWTDLPGATSSSLTLVSVAFQDDGARFRCLVANPDGGATSNEGVLSVPPVLFVRQGSAGGDDGASWDTAFDSLQDALAAAVSGNEIWVAQGTYHPGSLRTDSFVLVEGVALYGGFAGLEAVRGDRNWTANPTVLSGDIGTVDDVTDNTKRLLVGADGAVLDGFTITGAYHEAQDGSGIGAGMACNGVSPTVANCTFVDNFAWSWAGAMLNLAGAAPVVTNCSFVRNYAWAGGAVLNTGASPVITGCLFDCNTGGFGAAVYNDQGASPALTRCIFMGNAVSIAGGAMMNKYSAHGTLRDCVFYANAANEKGGALQIEVSSAPTLTNCLFTGNTALQYGGALATETGATPAFRHCVFTGNTAGTAGGALHVYGALPVVTNCIVWGNMAPTSPSIEASSVDLYTVEYSCIEGGWRETEYNGNVAADPLFVAPQDPDGPDDVWLTSDDGLALTTASPCVDAANGGVAPALDVLGRPRFDAPLVTDLGTGTPSWTDMGAYEWQGD